MWLKQQRNGFVLLFASISHEEFKAKVEIKLSGVLLACCKEEGEFFPY